MTPTPLRKGCTGLAYKAVLFDIDGTLVDSNEQHVTAWSFAFREAGHPQELEDIRLQIGKGADLLIPTLLPNLDHNTRAAITDTHGRVFKDAFLDNVRAFDQAPDLLRWVHDHGRKVVLASSAKREELEHYVEMLGVAELIEASTSSDDVESSKPEPDIFSAAIEKIGIDPADAVVVGDTIYDIEAAARAGIAAIGLLSGPFDQAALRDAGAIAVYADVSALLADIAHSPLRLED